MKFFLVIGKKYLHTFEQNGQKFELQYIEGSETYSYSSNNLDEDINAYLEALANEKNLSTVAKLEFDILEGADGISNAGIVKRLKDIVSVNQLYGLEDALKTVIKKLSRDKKLLIDEYGINYDGDSYKMIDKNIEKGEFDLLAYTIYSNDVIELMDTM